MSGDGTHQNLANYQLFDNALQTQIDSQVTAATTSTGRKRQRQTGVFSSPNQNPALSTYVPPADCQTSFLSVVDFTQQGSSNEAVSTVGHPTQTRLNEATLQASPTGLFDGLPPSATVHGIFLAGKFAQQHPEFVNPLNVVVLDPWAKILPCYNLVERCKYNIVCQNMLIADTWHQLVPSASLGYMLQATGHPHKDKICSLSEFGRLQISDGPPDVRWFCDLYTEAEWEGLEIVLIIDQAANLFARRQQRRGL